MHIYKGIAVRSNRLKYDTIPHWSDFMIKGVRRSFGIGYSDRLRAGKAVEAALEPQMEEDERMRRSEYASRILRTAALRTTEPHLRLELYALAYAFGEGNGGSELRSIIFTDMLAAAHEAQSLSTLGIKPDVREELRKAAEWISSERHKRELIAMNVRRDMLYPLRRLLGKAKND